jgi:DNA-binding NarL/FixJ family response regulator
MTDIDVLLVDDQDLFREGVRVIIDAQEGIRVVGTAADGLEAIRLVDELTPDVVLMDIRMPEMDGVEATRRIFAPDRVAARSKPVRVVVLTTFDLDDRAATAVRHGASGFLLKDATPARLTEAIRTVHAGSAVLASSDLATLLERDVRDPTPPPRAYLALTDKEREVFDAIARGLSNAEIAAHLVPAPATAPRRSTSPHARAGRIWGVNFTPSPPL